MTLLKHSKGLSYLARLLQHPGVEFHAIDLVGQSTGGLDASIHTGNFSSFTPPPAPAIEWVVRPGAGG